MLGDVDDDINQSRENIAITIHDTLITHTVALHLASGIHTEAFCSTVIFLLQTILDRVQKTTHPRLFKQEREERTSSFLFYRGYAAIYLIYPLLATLALI
jgi:hypothetical protein